MLGLSIFLGGIIALFAAYYVLESYLSPSTKIYMVPERGVYILSQGSVRIVFDAFTLANDSWMNDANALYIGKYSPVNTSSTYIALDRNSEIVGLLPLSGNQGISTRLPIYLPGKKTPEWMTAAKFYDEQFNMLSKFNK